MNILLFQQTGTWSGWYLAPIIFVVIVLTVWLINKLKSKQKLPNNSQPIVLTSQNDSINNTPIVNPPEPPKNTGGVTVSSEIRRKRQEIIDSLTTTDITDLGVTVKSQNGIHRMFKVAIDDAFRMQNRMVKQNGMTLTSNPTTAIVYVFPNVEGDIGTYGPSFKSFFGPGDPYDGSNFDQDKENPGGWVFAAEQVLNYSPAEIVVAEYKANWGGAKRAVYNGLDHVALELNGQHSEKDRTHQNGQSFHPLRPVSGYMDNYPEDEV